MRAPAEQAPASDVSQHPPAWLVYLSLRHIHPALARPAFRRALAHAIDREALAPLAPPNAIVATGGMVPPPLQGHTPDITPRFDPDRARNELARSGVTDGVEVAVLDEDGDGAVIRAVADQWREVLGLRFPVRSADPDANADLFWSGLIFQDGWFPGFADPEYYLRLLLHSEATDNHGGYASAHFDALIERACAERDGRRRLALFHEADRFAVAEDVAAIPCSMCATPRS